MRYILIAMVLVGVFFIGRSMRPFEYLSPTEQKQVVAEHKQEKEVQRIQQHNASLIVVQKLSSFADGGAYNGWRSTYMITYTPTGERFIGVSGIGISELGSHTRPSGKTRVTEGDER